jgi:hypothetical protein
MSGLFWATFFSLIKYFVNIMKLRLLRDIFCYCVSTRNLDVPSVHVHANVAS